LITRQDCNLLINYARNANASAALMRYERQHRGLLQEKLKSRNDIVTSYSQYGTMVSERGNFIGILADFHSQKKTKKTLAWGRLSARLIIPRRYRWCGQAVMPVDKWCDSNNLRARKTRN
jgi:hypothetical protein